MTCEARVFLTERVKMRDGIELACDVYLPPKEGRRYPVILAFSPYGGTSKRDDGALVWVSRGFAVVCADCRGCFKSGGKFTPWVNDVADAYDLLEWVAGQKWCDGNVGMIGGSYVGFTQVAAAAGRHPVLKAVAPSAVQSDIYSLYYAGGAQVLSFMSSWHIGMTRDRRLTVPAPNWADILRKMPISKIDDYAGMPSPSWKTIVAHDGRDAYWKKHTCEGRFGDVEVGFFLQNGWFDNIGPNVFSFFNEITGSAGFSKSSRRRYTCLRVGPWRHGVNMLEGEIDYGPEALVTEEPEVDFLTSLLRGKRPRTAANPAPLQIFVMGANRWRFENEWPLKRTQWTPFYLGSGGHANTSKGDGWLSRDPVGTKTCAPDVFTSDPANPVPSCGGRGAENSAQRNQSEIEKRKDVLVYTLPALTEPLEVTGPVSMKLFASISTPDADFAVKLVDVYPDGRPFNVCDGILRARFRGGLDKKPQMMKPGQVYELLIDVDVTSYLFKPGHRIRLEIAGSNFPHYARNPNTGKRVDTDTSMRTSIQTVYHSSDYPSCLILPVIPGSETGHKPAKRRKVQSDRVDRQAC